MPPSTNKELLVGIMVGTTGISLLLLWYRKIRKPKTAMNVPTFLSLGNTVDSMTWQDEVHHGQGAAAIFQARQIQILEKLNELLTNVEELKSEIRVLKEAIPKLEEYIHGELGGKTPAHKISPQHRARKRRLATVQSSGTSNSSEEAESEGGCFKEDRSFQPNWLADELTSNPLLHHGTSSIQPHTSPDLKTSHPAMRGVSFHRDSLRRGSKHLSSPSNTSTCSSFSGRSYSLFVKFQKSNDSLHLQQSRANFDSQENICSSDFKSSSNHFGFRFRRLFSTPKLSIIPCYERGTFLDLQLSSENILNPNETEIISKKSCVTDAEKYVSSCPEYNKDFMNFETRTNSSACRNSVVRSTYQQCTSPYLSSPSHISSYHKNGIATDIQETSQVREEDSLYPDSQSHTTDHSPAITQRHSSKSVACPVLHHVGFSLFYKDTREFTPFQNEVTTDYYEDENIGNLSQDEDESSPIEIPKIRYITANTDTEEQSFPVPVALNTHIEELKLDALLQKVDNLRTNESSKMESFELLCDYKEKFRDEIEFIWRFARAYGDMYELSTNTQEKKYYANIGKTLGEKAITRAPMNGHCHLWYAVLCGCVSEFEGLQNKINYGYRFKEHLDKAIQILPEEPFLYYLKGRWCYTVSKLSWIEKKMAATLFGKIPSSTVQEALQNFLKVEELHPGFSKSNYMFLAKCYMDHQQTDSAMKFCHLAMLLPCVTKEDKEAQKEVKKISTFLKR